LIRLHRDACGASRSRCSHRQATQGDSEDRASGDAGGWSDDDDLSGIDFSDLGL
jgi:hypothetical protein